MIAECASYRASSPWNDAKVESARAYSRPIYAHTKLSTNAASRCVTNSRVTPEERSGVARQVYQADRQAAAKSTAIGAKITVASNAPIPPETTIKKTSRPARGIHTPR